MKDGVIYQTIRDVEENGMKRKILVASLLLAAGSVAAQGWMQDPITGCKARTDAELKNQEQMTWSGACLQGKAAGNGVLVIHDKQGLLISYRGEMEGGYLQGVGLLYIRNDDNGKFDSFIGRFEKNQPRGEGIYASSEGWRMEGEFEGSFDDATGTLIVAATKDLADDAVVTGKFRKGKLDGAGLSYYETKSGEAYFGETENGKREGFGTLVHANEDTYIGEFAQGVASGYGTYEKTDGSAMIGIYERGAPNGPGSFIAANGDTYQGIFIDGKAEGLILVTRDDGTQFIETWENGEKIK